MKAMVDLVKVMVRQVKVVVDFCETDVHQVKVMVVRWKGCRFGESDRLGESNGRLSESDGRLCESNGRFNESDDKSHRLGEIDVY